MDLSAHNLLPISKPRRDKIPGSCDMHTDCRRHRFHNVRRWSLAVALMPVLALLWSCSEASEDIPEPSDHEPVCELTIRVGALHAPSPSKAGAKEAGSPGTSLSGLSSSPSRVIEGDFETPAFEYENIRTLRAIILRPDRTVEVNTRVDYTGTRDVESYTYRLKANEKKRIYLFVNEPAALTVALDRYKGPASDGSVQTMPAGYLEELSIMCPPAHAYIDNTGKPAGEGTWVPMSEFFDNIDTTIPDGQADAVYHKTVDLFVTRAAIKFSFNFSKGPGYTYETPYVVEAISISDMATTEFYLPAGTVYSPGKYTPSTNPFEGRYITKFTSPLRVTTSTYEFWPVAPLEVGNTTLSYNPQVYMLENAGTDYTVDLLVKDKNSTLPAQWLGPRPLPAPENTGGGPIPASLPRNTHVIVNISLDNPYTFEAAVVVEPFKSTELKPSFGFDP